jgi:ribonuclease D
MLVTIVNKENDQQYELFSNQQQQQQLQQNHINKQLQSVQKPHHQANRTPLGKVLESKANHATTPLVSTTPHSHSNNNNYNNNNNNNNNNNSSVHNNSMNGAINTPNTASKAPVRRKSKRSSLNHMLVTLQSLFKSVHARESKILTDGVKSDHNNPATWHKLLTFLFFSICYSYE